MVTSHGHAPIAVQVQEAAKLVGTAPSTIRMWCSVGVLPAVKVRKAWIIRLDELDKLTRAQAKPEKMPAQELSMASQ